MSRYGVLLVLLFPAFASPATGKAVMTGPGRAFTENKGQIIDQDNRPNPKVLYLLNTPGMNVQLRKGGFSYDIYSPLPSPPPRGDAPSLALPQGGRGMSPLSLRRGVGGEVDIHRIDFDFIGSDLDCGIVTTGKSRDYKNYYTTGTPVEGVTRVHSYQTVTYKSIYPGIDLELLTDEKQGFKYNIIVHPGGDLASVKMRIRGPDIDLTPEGTLKLKTTLGTIEETIPQSHFITSSGEVEAKARFIKTGHSIYGFSAETNIPAGATLVIDPVPGRIWSTYYGGADWDSFEYGSCSHDDQGNVFSSGNTMSTNNVATAGACQTVYGGGYDAFLVKFDRNGQPVWATYYGGEGQENGSNCTTDLSGNVFLTGATYSATNIATPVSHQPIYGGWEDGYLAKFGPDGIREWATYYGGTEEDGGASCTTDQYGNIYLCGSSHSTTGISTPGSHQPGIGSTMGTNAFLAKFDPQGVRLWGTYYGGNQIEGGLSCKADTNGHVIMCGMSRSPNNVATPGAHQETPGGGFDGFLVLFNSDGQRQWGTYYGGSSTDHLYYCLFSGDGNIYTSGESLSANNISTPGCHQPNLMGTTDAMLVKFSMAGVRQWGTYYGGVGNTISWGAAVDDSLNVFLCGQTSALAEIATPGSFQPVFAGPNLDAFLVKFNAAGIRKWGTYFGSTITDCGSACTVIADTIYLAGRGGLGLATPGSYQPNYGGICDAFLAKFVDCNVPDTATGITGPVSICTFASGIIYSVSPISNVTGYHWEVPPGAAIVSGQNTTAITVQFSETAVSGSVSVRGINSCGMGEPKSLSVTVLQTAIPTLTGSFTVAVGSTYTYTTETGMTNYGWNVSGGSITGGGGPSDNWAQVQWNTPGTQWVSVSYAGTNGCPPQLKYFSITVLSNAVVNFTAPDTICTGGTVNITNLSVGASTYYWNFCSGNANTNPVGVNILNPGGLLSIPTYITLVKDGNDCFSFVSCQGVGVVRYYHGTSFANYPLNSTNLGQFGLIQFSEEGIQVKHDDVTGNWFGFVNSYNTIVRLDFGNSLWNTPFQAVDLFPTHPFNMTHGLMITREGTSWIGFVTCSNGQNLVRLEFPTGLSGIPVPFDLGNLGGVLISPGAICLVQENSLWYAMIMAGGNTLARLTFGTSLFNTPTGVNLGNPGGFNSAIGLTLLRDCESTTGYWVNYLVNGELGKLTFPTGILGTVTGTVLGNIGELARPHSFSEIFRQNDALYAYITDRDNGTLTRLTFPPCINASVPSSTLFTPPPFYYNQPGTYNIHLIVDEGLPTMASLCKPIVVMPPPVVSLGTDKSICAGNSVTLDAGANFTGYLWSTGATTRTITVLTAGTYSVTATRWGCNASDTVNVTMLPAPAVALGPDQAICEGQTATFDAGACSGCTYQWANFTTSQPNVGSGQTYTTGTAGTYMVTVTNASGCSGKDTVQLTVTPALPVSVSISASPPGPVCAGTNVQYTASVINAGSSPVYQWKVNAGNATNATSSTFNYVPANGNCITCMVTSGVSCATGNPATSNQICMTVNQNLPVSVNITASENPVCAENPVTYTAFVVNPGSSPAYQWKVNSGNAGNATNASFTYQPVNGDQVSCVVTSSETCTTGNPATSTPVTMTVNPLLPVSITVTCSANPVCAGNPVTFTTYAGNPGSMPAYQWKVNAVNAVNATNASFTYNPANGDLVSCTLTSSESCTVGNPATSAPITMTVNPNMPASLTIAASANPFCAGSAVTFTANAVNAGSVPVYQWKINGTNAGTNNLVFTFNPAAGDLVSCIMTSSVTCVSGSPATSNTITMTATPLLPADVTISASANPFCAGNSVTFTATPVNGGSAPTYQWKVNANNANNASNANYAYNASNGDIVTCVMISNLNCVTSNPATSPAITMIARALPAVSFSNCFDTVTFLNAKPYRLKGGLPAGGQYSGPGVNSATGFFTPSTVGPGLKTITYGYTNVYTCMNSATKTILVKPTPSFICGNTFTDPRDNKAYHTVLIGTQCWLNENLSYGTEIPDNTPQTDNCLPEKYLRNFSFLIFNSVYQWDELMRYETSPGTQGLCPPGWHIPTPAEWDVLLSNYSGPGQAGTWLKDKLLPNGFDSYQDGLLYQNNTWSFTGGDYAGSMYWTSVASGDGRAVARGINEYNYSVSRYESARSNAFNARCLKDN